MINCGCKQLPETSVQKIVCQDYNFFTNFVFDWNIDLLRITPYFQLWVNKRNGANGVGEVWYLNSPRGNITFKLSSIKDKKSESIKTIPKKKSCFEILDAEYFILYIKLRPYRARDFNHLSAWIFLSYEIAETSS